MANTITYNDQQVEHFVMTEDVTHDNRLFEQGERYTVDSVVRTKEIVTTWLDSGQCTPYFDYPERTRPGHNRFPNRIYVDIDVSNRGQSVNRQEFDDLLAQAIGNPVWNEDGNMCRLAFRKEYDENGNEQLPAVLSTYASAVVRTFSHHGEALKDMRLPARGYGHDKLPSEIEVTFKGGGKVFADELRKGRGKSMEARNESIR